MAKTASDSVALKSEKAPGWSMLVRFRALLLTLGALMSAACQPAVPAPVQCAGAGGQGAGGAAAMEPLPTLVSPGHYRIPITPIGVAPSGAGGTASGGAGASSGGGGAGSGAILACVPAPPHGDPHALGSCGDGIRASAEQCDDGNTSNGDACSSECIVTPLLAAPRNPPSNSLPLPGRELGVSRHPLAVGCNTVGVSLMDRSSAPPVLWLASFSSVGVPGPIVDYGVANVDGAAPAVAGLSDDTFAVVWTDFDGDGDELGIQLRKVDPSAPTQLPSTIANSGRAFSQRAPDVVFDGSELVVAWVDDSDPVNGPDLRYRLFDPELNPKTDDLTLAATAASEADVALAAFNGGWAAAWRSGSAGRETVEVQSGATHWTVGPRVPARRNRGSPGA